MRPPQARMASACWFFSYWDETAQPTQPSHAGATLPSRRSPVTDCLGLNFKISTNKQQERPQTALPGTTLAGHGFQKEKILQHRDLHMPQPAGEPVAAQADPRLPRVC